LNDSERILDAVRRLVRQLRLSDREAQLRVGLSAAQLYVLYQLGKTPANSLGELAERTHTDQSSVSTVVTRLVTAGLVQRERAGDDARRLQLSLTRSGRAALQKAPSIAQEKLLAAVERLPAAEQKRFADTFTRLLEDIGADAARPPLLFEESAQNGKRTKTN
jgi:DNA-binding MarR family transcriptional regulator